MSKIKLFVGSVDYFKEKEPNAVRLLDLQEYINICKTNPLFTELSKKTYYYTDTDVDKQTVEFLKESVHTLYFVTSKVDKRSYLYKFCKKNDDIYYEPGINAAKLKKRYNNISSKSINKILVASEDTNSLRSIFNILDSFDEVTDEKVNWMFSAQYEDKIFDALDFLMVGNSKRFYKLYEDLLLLNESKFKFMYLLYTKLKTLLMLKSYIKLKVKDIQDKTKLNYYQVKNNLNIASKHSVKDLRNWFMECGRIERDLKYGVSDLDIDLENLIINILTKR